MLTFKHIQLDISVLIPVNAYCYIHLKKGKEEDAGSNGLHLCSWENNGKKILASRPMKDRSQHCLFPIFLTIPTRAWPNWLYSVTEHEDECGQTQVDCNKFPLSKVVKTLLDLSLSVQDNFWREREATALCTDHFNMYIFRYRHFILKYEIRSSFLFTGNVYLSFYFFCILP